VFGIGIGGVRMRSKITPSPFVVPSSKRTSLVVRTVQCKSAFAFCLGVFYINVSSEILKKRNLTFNVNLKEGNINSLVFFLHITHTNRPSIYQIIFTLKLNMHLPLDSIKSLRACRWSCFWRPGCSSRKFLHILLPKISLLIIWLTMSMFYF
jgi:hypothetical protein